MSDRSFPLLIGGRAAAIFWGVGRLPGLLLVVYVMRGPIVSVIEAHLDILTITRFVIDVLSTPVARVALGALFGCLCLLVVAAARRLPPLLAYCAVLVATGG